MTNIDQSPLNSQQILKKNYVEQALLAGVVRNQNDTARREILFKNERKSVPCTVVFSNSLKVELSQDKLVQIMVMVRSYDDYDGPTYAQNNDTNDPFGEHCHGVFDFENINIIFEFEYLDASNTPQSSATADLAKTKRVLRIKKRFETQQSDIGGRS